ncbi:urease accessory protein UreE [Exilibacterium tricleocarpae]|uniref:Urease accessory protein UreE n=1 Tax=Exilibacterium tricleocarpae TaxID=2591008 RepID=A0A545SYT9_9GAMM|nr:urease accessory protein UreE [Exilibacterium tricleocarpae]TQV70130.1 urease accessory protein UreE [Exilibacterium tricleocarpae]
MLEVFERLAPAAGIPVHDRLMLDHQQREKGRFKATAASGEEVRVFLERGKTLAIGEILRSRCGKNLTVVGAVETVATASSHDWLAFSRACYHLGNRHVKLQIGERWLRLKPDHVLQAMLLNLGLQVIEEDAVFVPEAGAYAHTGNHTHAGGHGHDHHHH